MRGARRSASARQNGQLCGVVNERDLFALQRVSMRQVNEGLHTADTVEKLARAADVAKPVLEQPGDAVIKVTKTAICGSDLHIYQGHGFTDDVGYCVGHEAVGARVERFKNVGTGRLDATHNFDNDVGPEDELMRICREKLGGQIDRSLGVQVANCDAGQLEARAHAGSELLRVVQQDLGHIGPDRSAAE